MFQRKKYERKLQIQVRSILERAWEKIVPSARRTPLNGRFLSWKTKRLKIQIWLEKKDSFDTFISEFFDKLCLQKYEE